MPSNDVLGPVDFLVLEFPDGQLTGAAFGPLMELAARDIIRVLDVEFVSTDDSGAPVVLGTDQVGDDQVVIDLVGAGSGLLDDDDLQLLVAELEPGAVGVVVVFENSWVESLAAAAFEHGVHLLGTGPVDLDDAFDE